MFRIFAYHNLGDNERLPNKYGVTGNQGRVKASLCGSSTATLYLSTKTRSKCKNKNLHDNVHWRSGFSKIFPTIWSGLSNNRKPSLIPQKCSDVVQQHIDFKQLFIIKIAEKWIPILTFQSLVIYIIAFYFLPECFLGWNF